MPMNTDAERQVLGAIVLFQGSPNDCMMQAQTRLMADDFGLHSHRLIYKAMEELNTSEKPLEYTTLVERLIEKDELESVGGVQYVTSIADGLPRIKNISAYVEIVLKMSAQRQLIQASTVAIQRAYERDEPGDIAGGLQDRIDLITNRAQSDACVPASAVVDGLCERLMKQYRAQARYIGLPTPIGRLTYALGGLGRKENIVVAGDTGGGKTSLAVNTTEINCLNDKWVHWFSIEQDRESLLLRLAASRTGINHMRIRNTANLSEAELDAVIAELQEIKRWKLTIDDTSNLTTRQLYARGRMIAARGGDLQIVDYLQRVKAPGGTIREQVNNSSACVTQLAKDGNTPLLNLSQLARLEKTSKESNMRKPTMHDLKESGNIEQDAHAVVLVWREQILDAEGRREFTGNDAMIIGKNRNGPCFEIAVRYDAEVMVWREAEQNYSGRDGKAMAATY